MNAVLVGGDVGQDGACRRLERDAEDGVGMDVQVGQLDVGAIAGEDAVLAVSDLYAVERHAACADDRHRVTPVAVDDRGANAFQGDAVFLDDDGSGAEAGETNRLIGAGVLECIRERLVVAIEHVVVGGDDCAGDEAARKQEHGGQTHRNLLV